MVIMCSEWDLHELQACVLKRRFILQDLSHVDRRQTPWVVINMHRPIYTSSTSGVGPSSVIRVAEDLRAALEPLLILYQVCFKWGSDKF